MEGNQVSYEVRLGEIAVKLQLFLNDGGVFYYYLPILISFIGFNKQKVLYGTKNGCIGLVDLYPTEGILCYEINTQTSASWLFYKIQNFFFSN